MKNIFLVSLSLLVGCKSSGQGLHVHAVIENLPDGTVYLSSYYKSEYLPADSVRSVNGTFYFHREEGSPDGMYRIDFDRPGNTVDQKNRRYIEFIWAGESVGIYADYTELALSVSFADSEENELLGVFREYEVLYDAKMSAVYPVIDMYPEKDDYYILTGKHLVDLQESRDEFLQGLAEDNPDLFAAKIISAYRSVVLTPDLTGEMRMDYLRKHFFDRAPVNNPELLYAPVYTGKLIEYLKLYRDPSYSFGDQEDAFIHAVDAIMANVSGDPELRSFAVEYLLDGFESFGMEKVQTYIVDTYVDETCTTDAVELAYARVQGYRKMAEGQTAEDIFIRSSENRMVRLSEADADYVLVLFWATYCEHCMKLLPELHEWYDTERPSNLEVFAVSIDTSETAWRNFIRTVNPPWINSLEPMGWEGKSAEDYNVYATPTMFLLDRKRKIVAKPYTIRELKREVRQLDK